MKLGKFVGLALMALTLGLAGQSLAAEPIKIGVYLPLTGQNAFGGQLELEGVQLALKDMPEVLGRPIELVVVDNKSDKVEAANAVKRLVERDKVVALIGTYGSSLAMAGAEVAEKAKVPGVGKKTAQRLILELKSTFAKDKGFVPVDVIPGQVSMPVPAAAPSAIDDARAALLSMGFSPQETDVALSGYDGQNMRVEDLLGAALKRLGMDA